MGGYDNLILGPAIPGAGNNGIAVGDSRLNKGGLGATKEGMDKKVDTGKEEAVLFTHQS